MSDSDSSPPRPEPGRIEQPSTAARARRGWSRWLPGLRTLREYEVAWLRHDVVAGLVLATMLVPVGIAYAMASGVPGIYGLYASIVPLLAYALFGPSRILVLGPDSSLAAVILAVVLPLSGGDPLRAVALAGMMAIVSGTVCIVAGVARLGFVTELLSKPIRYGYMNGIALTVLVSQLPTLFGFSVEGDGVPTKSWAFAQALLDGANELDGADGRRRDPGRDTAAQGREAGARDADRGHRCDDPRRRAGPRGARRRVDPGHAAARSAGVRHPVDHLCRHRPGHHRRLRGRPRVVRRHQRALACLCRALRHTCRSQSGDGGSRGRQPGRGILPGLSRQQQLFPHSCGRSRRRQNTARRRGGGGDARVCCWCLRRTCCDICRNRRWRRS